MSVCAATVATDLAVLPGESAWRKRNRARDGDYLMRRPISSVP